MKLPKGWETAGGIIFGAASWWLGSNDMYRDVTSELVTLLGIVMAAFIPTMLLAATTLRAGRFTAARLLSLSAALDRQITMFGGLFLYALLASLLVIGGKVAGWHLPSIHIHLYKAYLHFDPSPCIQVCISSLLAFLALRTLALVAGIRSLLRLTSSMALDEANERERAVSQAERADLDRYTQPKDYGASVGAVTLR